MKVKDWIKRLQNEFSPDEEICVHLWQRADVQGVAMDRHNWKLTNEQADEILEDIERHIDSELGVSWMTLYVYIETFVTNDKRGYKSKKQLNNM